jgi:low affinity Fe/Cu permease
MKMKLKTFPKLQIFISFFLIFLYSCQKEEALTIDKEQFIEIYARLLIINEMKIKKGIRDSLFQKLYSDNKIMTSELDSSISHYNSNPTEWVEIYNLVREKIQKIRSEYQADSSIKIDSLISKPRKNLREESYKRRFLSDDKEKELIDKRKKPQKKKNNNLNKSPIKN